MIFIDHRYMYASLFITLATIAPAMAQASSDTTPPQLVSFSFAPSSIDVTANAQTVTVTLRVTDDLSGFTGDAPSDGGFTSTSGHNLYFFYSRVSGTDLDGVYQGTVIIPKYVESGIWQVWLALTDNAGNLKYYSVSDLAASGFPTDLAVTSTPDMQPPTIVSATFTPESVDVSDDARTVTVDLHLKDDLSGVDMNTHGGSPIVTLSAPANPPTNQSSYATGWKFQLFSGTTQDGIWRSTIAIPRYSESGLWYISRILLYDAVGNSARLNASQLSDLGIASGVTVLSNPSDVTPPQLTGLTVSPTAIDTSKGPSSIALTFSASDDLSGVSWTIPSVYLELSSPSGNQTPYLNSTTPPALLSGSPTSGVWQVQFPLPQYSEEGNWKIDFIQVHDAANNLITYDTSSLAALGFPTTFTVTRLSPKYWDTDADGKGDISVWRPSTGVWFTLPSGSSGSYTSTLWGLPSDKPVPGDFDGDGKSDVAVWRPSTGIWYIRPSGSPGTFISTQWGLSTDIAVPGDYDGDGKDDIAVWRPGTGVWYVLRSGSPGTFTSTQWGLSADKPVPADYDGDGKTDIAVWRPSSGGWYVLKSRTPGSYTVTWWGVPTDIPTPGDYDSDGRSDIAVWRPSQGIWYILTSGAPGTYSTRYWGTSGDIPISGDYDGDGKIDIGVWRPGNGSWYILPSKTPGSYTTTQWGVSTDVAISPLTGILRSIP